MAVEVMTRPTLTISSPQLMFKSELMPGNTVVASREYDVSADGSEFFAVSAASQTDPERRFVVVTEWSSMLCASYVT
ncbi:MAG TPA: hypothetical protein VH854_07625 [Thermoanaerobaculia bacterium]|jgi:hypothetical protein|nr:hypothetical protein [Thermoanaerobaculia bacterium]